MTVMPFESVQRTASMDSTCSSPVMLPGVGSVASSGTSSKVSVYGSTVSASAPSSCVSSAAASALPPVGSIASGPRTRSTVFPGSVQEAARSSTSANESCGSSSWYSSHSASIPGTGVPLRKWFLYEPASWPDRCWSRCVYTRSTELSRLTFSRASSLSVKPCCPARCSSSSKAANPRSTPSCSTRIVKVRMSSGSTNDERPVADNRYGGSATWPRSNSRAFSIMKASRSVTTRRNAATSWPVSGATLRTRVSWVPGASGSVNTSMSGASLSGTSKLGRLVGSATAARSCEASPSGGGAKCCLSFASISSVSKSPTATTAISSGLYQRS